MVAYFKRSLRDIFRNRFLSMLTITTIAVAILIASAFAVFFINLSDIVNTARQGIRVMVYLSADSSEARRLDLKRQILEIRDVAEARFIPKAEAMERLRNQLRGQPSLLADLSDNPLPDAFEIRLRDTGQNLARIQSVAADLETLKGVEEVEYGQKWFGRFASILELMKLAGTALGALFLMATIFIVANTIRIVLYSRREEIEIIRMVGAEDGFITIPFYLQGLLQGAAGGLIGLLLLYFLFRFVSANMAKDLAVSVVHLRFLPLKACAGITLGSMVAGWLGCFISLKQYLRQYDSR